MLSRASATLARKTLSRASPFVPITTPKFVIPPIFSRTQTTVREALTAEDARAVSGYKSIDYTISEDMTVYDAVQKFAGFNIGCLVVTNAAGKAFLCDLQRR